MLASLSDAEVRPFEGMGHGEIVAHPQEMADEIRRFMDGKPAPVQAGSGPSEGEAPASGDQGAFWNRFAFAYDLATRNGDAGLAQAAGYVAGFLEPTDVVLDAACGTGAFACALAQRAGFVAACDLAPNMVARARAKAKRLGIPDDRIGFGLEDVTALSFGDAAFDAAVAGNVLHLLDDPDAAVAELCRVVKPGGVIAIPNYVNAEAVDRRFLKLIEAAGFSARHEWDQAGFLDFLERAGLDMVDNRSFEAKQPLCVAICRAGRAG